MSVANAALAARGRVFISGEGLEEIPVLVPRKKAQIRQQIKDARVTGVTLNSVGVDECYGLKFEDKVNILLHDFTVI